MVHDYFGIDLDVAWTVIERDLLDSGRRFQRSCLTWKTMFE